MPSGNSNPYMNSLANVYASYEERILADRREAEERLRRDLEDQARAMDEALARAQGLNAESVFRSIPAELPVNPNYTGPRMEWIASEAIAPGDLFYFNSDWDLYNPKRHKPMPDGWIECSCHVKNFLPRKISKVTRGCKCGALRKAKKAQALRKLRTVKKAA